MESLSRETKHQWVQTDHLKVAKSHSKKNSIKSLLNFYFCIIMIITINYGSNVLLHKILDLVKSVYYGLSRDDYG